MRSSSKTASKDDKNKHATAVAATPSGLRRLGRLLWAGLLVALLAACSTQAPPQQATPQRFDSVVRVDVQPTDTQPEVERRYGGSALVFRPEAGFAVLGFTADETRLTTLATTPNQDVFALPEATASGWTAWSGGWTAWSGGWTAWSGGWTAWSGGSESANTFGENLPLWDLVNLPEAQALSTKLGDHVTVAVIDTGVDLDHPALLCATVTKKGDCKSALAPSSMWADFVDNDNVPDEVPGAAYGHGTAVAGIIVQVAPKVTILPIRALGPDGSGDVSAVVQAIDHALLEGADIINLSLGTNVPVASLRAVLDLAASQGVYVFASAGNQGQQGLTYPASLGTCNAQVGSDCNVGQYLIGVSSVDAFDVKSSFANYGLELEMLAPGEMIHTLAPDAQRAVWSGTSFATPMVAGAMALALAEPAKNWASNANPGSDLPNSAHGIRAVNEPFLALLLGKGRLDAQAFMQAVLK